MYRSARPVLPSFWRRYFGLVTLWVVPPQLLFSRCDVFAAWSVIAKISSNAKLCCGPNLLPLWTMHHVLRLQGCNFVVTSPSMKSVKGGYIIVKSVKRAPFPSQLLLDRCDRFPKTLARTSVHGMWCDLSFSVKWSVMASAKRVQSSLRKTVNSGGRKPWHVRNVHAAGRRNLLGTKGKRCSVTRAPFKTVLQSRQGRKL